MSDKLKGVWIDGGVWECDKITLIQKHFLQKIKDLDNGSGCFASNGFFASFFGLSKPRCSQIISSLKDKKLITIKLKYKGKEVEKRVLRISKGGIKYFKEGIKNINRGIKNIKGGYLENAKDNNTVINNTVNNTFKKELKEKDILIQNLKEENNKLKTKLKNLTAKPKDLITGVEIPREFTPEITEAFRMFLKMRIEVKSPFKSPTSIQTKVNSLAKNIKTYGDNAVLAAINKSIENQWLGIKVNWNKGKEEEVKEISTYTPAYKIPTFQNQNQRYFYFMSRFEAYKPYLNERLINTEYRQRALYDKDAEGLCYQLEQQNPDLAKLEVKFTAV